MQFSPAKTPNRNKSTQPPHSITQKNCAIELQFNNPYKPTKKFANDIQSEPHSRSTRHN